MKAIFNRHTPYHIFYDDMGKIVSEVAEKLNIDIKHLRSMEVIDDNSSSGPPGVINFSSMINYYRYVHKLDRATSSIPLPWQRYNPNVDLMVLIYKNGLLLNPTDYTMRPTSISFSNAVNGTIQIVRASIKLPSTTLISNFSITNYSVIITNKNNLDIPWGKYTDRDLFLQLYYIPYDPLTGSLRQGGSLMLENEDYSISEDETKIEFNRELNGVVVFVRHFKVQE